MERGEEVKGEGGSRSSVPVVLLGQSRAIRALQTDHRVARVERRVRDPHRLERRQGSYGTRESTRRRRARTSRFVGSTAARDPGRARRERSFRPRQGLVQPAPRARAPSVSSWPRRHTVPLRESPTCVVSHRPKLCACSKTNGPARLCGSRDVSSTCACLPPRIGVTPRPVAKAAARGPVRIAQFADEVRA